MTSNLLNDSIFYNLLDKNKESNTTGTTNTNGSLNNIPSFDELVYPKHDDNDVGSKNEDVVDFSFLNNVAFPLNGGDATANTPNTTAVGTGEITSGIGSTGTNGKTGESSLNEDQSYQQSIFSENLSSINDTFGSGQSDIGNYNDFLNKDIPFQINSELPSLSNLPLPLPLQLPSLEHINYPRSSISKHFIGPYSQQIQSTLPNSSNSLNTINSTYTPSLSNGSISKPSTYHKCPFCQRQFKNKSYLTRHLKKHGDVKDFKCPFFNEESTKCHHSDGEFSRKDTFKAHLKSIHFIYPIGVAKTDRNSSIGRCAGCFKEFKNNNEWLSQHIEVGICPGFANKKSV